MEVGGDGGGDMGDGGRENGLGEGDERIGELRSGLRGTGFQTGKGRLGQQQIQGVWIC